MKYLSFKPIILLLFIGMTILSCGSRKKIIYLQTSNSNAIKNNVSYEPIIQRDDVLMIVVSAENQEVTAPYNMKLVSVLDNSEIATGRERLQTYLIDKDGDIEFPILGKIRLAGLTRIEAVKKMKLLLANHIKDAIVNLRILNFKISVLGEVNRPGVHTVDSERITLLEALSLSGDLTIYGKRNSILVIHEKDGVKTIEKVDITNSDFINSPNYYLSQNDVVYVEPNKTKVNNSVIGPNISIALSAISLLITIIALTTR
ncbi:MAG: polysaccharide biosynthesis/export family protein [Bacteroidota bacterium]